MFERFLLFSVLVIASLVALPSAANGHHLDNGHSNVLYPDVDEYEMNSRTVNGEPIPLRLLTFSSIWAGQLGQATTQWNSGIFPVSGFDVFVWDNNVSGYIDVEIALTTQQPNRCFDVASHGCVLSWDPAKPSGLIFLYGPHMTAGNHGRSDLMHEMGHVLLNAGEHYPTYNCTSIMGHSSVENAGAVGYCASGSPQDTITTVKDHDRTDFRDIYGVEDNQNAAYVEIGYGQLVHSFESGYQGGDGRAVHQEYENVIDVSVNNINGSYSHYHTTGRRVDNNDDSAPETVAVGGFPPLSEEWCFKIHGHSQAVSAGSAGEWGPFSKRYCVNRSGANTGVFVTSYRNSSARFTVYNFSGSTIVNVQLRTNPAPGSLICGPWDIANGQSRTCTWNASGTGSLDLWYNNAWIRQDFIGFDQ